MDWLAVSENFIGSTGAGILVGILLYFGLTKFYEKLTEKRNSIGVLKIVSAELQFNKMVLEQTLTEGFESFETHMRRGRQDEISVSPADWEDMAKFLATHLESLIFSAFTTSFKELANLENEKLTEKIINYYYISLQYQTNSIKLGQMNWVLLDEFKTRLKTEIKSSEQIINNIQDEIRLIKRPAFKKLFKEIAKITKWLYDKLLF